MFAGPTIPAVPAGAEWMQTSEVWKELSSRPVCKHYAAQKCNYGDSCNRFHQPQLDTSDDDPYDPAFFSQYQACRQDPRLQLNPDSKEAEKLAEDVKAVVAERPFWPFSAVGFSIGNKDRNVFTGDQTEFSFEEMRYLYYRNDQRAWPQLDALLIRQKNRVSKVLNYLSFQAQRARQFYFNLDFPRTIREFRCIGRSDQYTWIIGAPEPQGDQQKPGLDLSNFNAFGTPQNFQSGAPQQPNAGFPPTTFAQQQQMPFPQQPNPGFPPATFPQQQQTPFPQQPSAQPFQQQPNPGSSFPLQQSQPFQPAQQPQPSQQQQLPPQPQQSQQPFPQQQFPQQQPLQQPQPPSIPPSNGFPPSGVGSNPSQVSVDALFAPPTPMPTHPALYSNVFREGISRPLRGGPRRTQPNWSLFFVDPLFPNRLKPESELEAQMYSAEKFEKGKVPVKPPPMNFN